DSASGRALHVSWTGTGPSARIASVATDPPASGQAPYTWTYGYTNGLLSSVCTPLSAGSCTTYAYTPSSQYRSVVLNDNPTGYWPLGEASGASTASNIAAQAPGAYDATYSGVTLGSAGALTGSPDTGITGSSASTAGVVPSYGLFLGSLSQAWEIWFKA